MGMPLISVYSYICFQSVMIKYLILFDFNPNYSNSSIS